MAMERKLELLSPAGDWERLEMAVAYGADAVSYTHLTLPTNSLV